MKATRTISSYVLLVGIMGLSIVGGVVAYQIFAAATKTQTTAEEATAIKPLDGVIDQTTIDSLKRRVVYTDAEMNLLVSTASATTPTPTVTEVQTSTASATTQ